MQRNNAIDFTRAIAIIIIVTCHFLLFGGVDGLCFIGKYLAYVGNFIFFAISALLFGMVYEKRGASAFEAKPFMKKRIVRLFASLWPYLIAILTIYSIIGVECNLFKAILNFLGLGWFAKLPNIGHLWFITMIILCYTMYVVFCNILNIKQLGGGAMARFTVCEHNIANIFR